jgi:WD40 repeat protein
MEFIITQNSKTKLEFWKFPSGEFYYSINHDTVIWSFDLSDDGKIIVFNDYYGIIHIVSLYHKKTLKKINTNFFLIQIKITPNVDRIISVYDKMNILNIKLYPKFDFQTLVKHQSTITEYNIYQLKDIYITCGLDNKIKISNIDTNNTIKEINNYQSYVLKIYFYKDNFYTLSLDEQIKVWDLNKYKFKKYLNLDINPILDFKFKSNNSIVYSNNNQELIEKDLITNATKVINLDLYTEQIEFTKNNDIIYINNLGELYHQNKIIIKSDIVRFEYFYFKNKKENVFDKLSKEILQKLLEVRINSDVSRYILRFL